MWTFDNPPRRQWEERYQFEPSEAWLEHVRLASVRLNDGGSGSFVSSDGLLMTNQHVAGGQLQKISTRDRDYTKEGFYAAAREEELKSPDLEINILASYEDVTRRVQNAVKPGASDKEANDQRNAAMAVIEKESAERTGLRSEVVTLYSGGEYWLYRFKKYTDIRLVFAPEEQIAFFGGDYDNFTYPQKPWRRNCWNRNQTKDVPSVISLQAPAAGADRRPCLRHPGAFPHRGIDK
jgi:hypothetical protein